MFYGSTSYVLTSNFAGAEEKEEDVEYTNTERRLSGLIDP